MAGRRRRTSRSPTVGIAIAAPALRRAVIEALAGGRFKASAFAAADVQSGDWPRRRFAAVVASPAAFRVRRRLRTSSLVPVILVLRAADLVRGKALLAQADGYVLTDRLELLPSAVILSGDRLSVLPAPGPVKRGGAGRKANATKKK